jgi:hypothetical protein
MIKLKNLEKLKTRLTLPGVALALLLATCLLLPAAPAQSEGEPGMPHQFYGYVYIGGSPASAGTKVEAYVNASKAAETTVLDAQGSYSFQVPGTAGATVTFYVGGALADQVAAWQGGGITELNLTVAGTPPTVVTNAATNNTTCTTATLNGNLTSRGTASSVQVSFEWGLTEAYGNPTTPQTKNSTGTFSANLTGLTPEQTYHFRAKAVGVGTGYGSDLSFTTPPCALDIVTACPLTGGRVNQSYSVTLHASGGTSPYTWSKVSGNLPTGLSLSTDGVISITPTAAGTFNFRIRVTDSATPTHATKEKDCSITISPAGAGPPAPALVSPGTSITFKWSESTGATKYWLQVNTKSKFTGIDVFNAEVGNVTSYEVTTGLAWKKTYYWRVKAGDDTDWGSWSVTRRVRCQ